MLADLLSDPRRIGDPVSGAVLDEARALLEGAAADATKLGGWSNEDPLRLSKGPVGWLLRCPRRAVVSATVVAGSANADDLAIGQMVDAAAKLVTLSPRQPVTVDDARAFLVACGDSFVDQHLADIGPDAATSLLTERAAPRIDRLVAGWPAIDPSWWPRVEEPVRVRLADGAVMFSGRLDMLLGGPPTDRPGLVIEVKSGRWHDAVRADAHLYGLLVGLRDGVAPASVVTVTAREGETQLEPIRPAVLRHAAERVAVALGTAARLAAGEPPIACPGSYCTHCPVRDECPEAKAAEAAA